MEIKGYSSGVFAVFQGEEPVELSADDTKKFQIFCAFVVCARNMKRCEHVLVPFKNISIYKDSDYVNGSSRNTLY